KCVIMVTPDVSNGGRQQLAQVFDEVVSISYIQFKCRPLRTHKQRELYSSWIERSFTKWCCLTLVKYDKIILIDADTIAIHNMDELFLSEPPGATFSSPWSEPFTSMCPKQKEEDKGKVGIFNPYQGIAHGQKIPSVCVSQGLDGDKSGRSS